MMEHGWFYPIIPVLSGNYGSNSLGQKQIVHDRWLWHHHKKPADFPDMQDATITCRLIKIDLPNGEKEILCTSLVDIKNDLANISM